MITHTTELEGLKAIEILTGQVRTIVTTELGPRIAWLSPLDGENLFYWKVNDSGREGWRLLGGHRVWATRPMADESEDAYAADNDPCEVSESDGVVTVTGAMHPFLKTRRGLQIRAPDDCTLEVTSFIRNEGSMLYSAGVWCPTCVVPHPGMTFGVLLGDRRLSWDVVRLIVPRTWADHSSRVSDPQIRFEEDFMIVDPAGVETKRMLWAPWGTIAMTWPERGLSFIKRTLSDPAGQYPLGCNLALYVAPGNFMVEMESYGEERTLMPGDTIFNVETWKVIDEVFDWQEPDRLLSLVG